MKICDELKILRKNYWKLEGSSLNSVEIKSISKPTVEFLNEKILWSDIQIILVGSPNERFFEDSENKKIFDETIKIIQFDRNNSILEIWELDKPEIIKISFGELSYLTDELVETTVSIKYKSATLNNKKIVRV